MTSFPLSLLSLGTGEQEGVRVKTIVRLIVLASLGFIVTVSFGTITAATCTANPSDILLELEHKSDGAVKYVSLNGKRVFDAAKHRRLTVFERYPNKSVKRVFINGTKVYEQSWDKNGKPLGKPYIVLSTSDRRPAPQPTTSPRPTYRPQPQPTYTAPFGNRHLPAGTTAQAVRKKLLSYEGAPYRAGGYDRYKGFKTAGLIWHFFNSYKVYAPRMLQEQAKYGKLVPPSKRAPGDVLIFSTRADDKPNILGLYAGDNEMVYMSFSKKKARRLKINTPYWSKYYRGARRFFGEKPPGIIPSTDESPEPIYHPSQPTQPTQPTRIALPSGKVYQQGMASFYGGGDGFNGTPTANGETFDHTKFTAAHRTLPFNTMVKVVRTDTGASCVVRINDRGPFIRGRIVDLSYAAAKKLNMVSAGVTKVNIYIVK